ncbi:MAG: RnfABCDGE type electron transport complex subunit C [Lentisphaeria bacterium]|nr:RnfABCDGE type electron transport complex subunit C [Lentisphaeria bacterium]
MKTFRGGVHPEEHKELSRDAQLTLFNPRGEMVFPLSMHIGKPAKPVVQKGDAVKAGQLIAEADGFISAHVFSSCSGTVKAIEERRILTGQKAMCIVIDNDGSFTLAQGVGVERKTDTLDAAQIVAFVRDAGIVGLGGAGFPTHVKLAPKEPEKIKYLIANGSECEPYLTCNDQLMRSKAEEIVSGLEIMLRLFPNAKGYIAIEKNKPEAINAMQTASAGVEHLEVVPLETKYPQGGERSLIHVIAGVDFPASKLPADYGCLVENVGTIYAHGSQSPIGAAQASDMI